MYIIAQQVYCSRYPSKYVIQAHLHFKAAHSPTITSLPVPVVPKKVFLERTPQFGGMTLPTLLAVHVGADLLITE